MHIRAEEQGDGGAWEHNSPTLPASKAELPRSLRVLNLKLGFLVAMNVYLLKYENRKLIYMCIYNS